MSRRQARQIIARAGGLLLALALLPFAPRASAEPRPAEEIVIRAREAMLNQHEGLGLYEGDAELRQGDRSLKADRIRIELKNGEPARIEATGQPVRLEETGVLEASGERLVYDVAARRIRIFDNARVNHQGRIFEGARLEYDLETRQVNATGGEDGRVKMVIPAEETESR